VNEDLRRIAKREYILFIDTGKGTWRDPHILEEEVVTRREYPKRWELKQS
jgi:hypothetical protein